MPKGNQVYIPEAGRGVSRQRKRARRRQRELLEEFSFLFNWLSPWNWIIQREGFKSGRAAYFLGCQVRS